MDKEDVLKALAREIPEKNIIRNCDMSGYTSFRAGGSAYALVVAGSIGELRAAFGVLSKSDLKYMVMGNGTNILVKDGGYSGVIIKIGDAFSDIKTDGYTLTAGAGALLSSVSSAAMEAGLSGLEFAAGIPGSVGGAVFMNAGAYGGEMKDVVSRVRLMSKDGTNEYTLSNKEMGFAYRYSVLHGEDGIVTEVVFELSAGSRDEIKEKTRGFSALRNAKQPVSFPSAGSFFKRPEGYFAGKLIQDARLAGLSVGGAQVSALHAGFIINTGNASADDIIGLMDLVRHTVYDKFGVRLEPEVRIIGE